MEPFVLNNKDSGPKLFAIEPWNSYSKSNGLITGYTSRAGGVGTEPYSSLNCAYHVGDNPEDVIENRRRIAEEIGIPAEAWTCGEQVHKSEIAIVTEADRGRGFLNRESAIQDTDGLLTNVRGVLLTSFYADCVPLYFYDPVNEVVGLAHAGWKGTVQKIAERMIERMEEHYGSKRADIRTAIGPSIGSCCYEVDDYVMDRVKVLYELEQGKDEYEDSAYRKAHQPAPEGKSMLDLKEVNRHIMMKAGILPDHIECTSWCTSCHPELFFSYRKEGGITGRMASWIGLEER
ncbi:peptidoglycan editing factor PgeF [Paenibacillus urinalis]|uniref:Purine nucleoside phosphorylase n=1 Tax=Paenibacillus urinalis TaxID=521520 RepID=A0AAX3MYS3_9BACL|nr:peptidoglycan editing factor PgeF [Paenibacillus urinalis]WDH81517.1 peptidoglycan editing factor PgeF [Paenibacillus urinalis]